VCFFSGSVTVGVHFRKTTRRTSKPFCIIIRSTKMVSSSLSHVCAALVFVAPALSWSPQVTCGRATTAQRATVERTNAPLGFPSTSAASTRQQVSLRRGRAPLTHDVKRVPFSKRKSKKRSLVETSVKGEFCNAIPWSTHRAFFKVALSSFSSNATCLLTSARSCLFHREFSHRDHALGTKKNGSTFVSERRRSV